MRRIAVLLVLLAGCGGGDEDAAPTTTETPTTASTTSTTAPSTVVFEQQLRSIYNRLGADAVALVTDCFRVDIALSRLESEGPSAALAALLPEVDIIPADILDHVAANPSEGLPMLAEACALVAD